MAIPTTPAEWLPILAKRLDDRQSDITTLRSYVNGNPPLPEMGRNTRATWEAFQRKACTNFGTIACQSHANRIRVQNVRVGSDDQSEASLVARRISRDNRLPMVIGDAVWDMLTARTGYMVSGRDNGRALITSERPEQFYAEPDPVRPWRSRAAIKVWRDSIDEVDWAWVWTPGVRELFTRPSYATWGHSSDRHVLTVSSGGWVTTGTTETYPDTIPVWIFNRRDGLGLIEPHTDLLDRINLIELQIQSTSAIQAFKQRALKKDPGVVLPERDEAGNPIDWEKVFEPAPGALWDLPAGIDIWESGTTDPRSMLESKKASLREFAAVSGTPVSMLQPDSANQSATGAAATTAQQVDACESDIERIRLAAAACIAVSLQIEGVVLAEDETVEVDFESPAWVTLAEKMDAYSKAIAAGMSPAMAQKTYLGWSQDQIDEDERHRRRSSAQAFVASLPTTALPAPALAG